MAFSVSYNYRIIDQYTAPLRKIAQSTKNFDAVAKRTAASIKGLSSRLNGMQNAIASIAGVIGGAALIGQFTSFESAMNSVNAVSQATEEQFAELRKTATELGRTTQFTATETALGMDMLARNGLKVGQVLGAITPTLSLAAATGTGLANAANIATDVMFNFGKTAADLGPIMDRITGVAVKSKIDIDNYRLALGMAGGAAGKLGVSLDDFNTVIAATAGSFSSGSDAGTSFKNFLVRLGGDTKEARVLMGRLGLYTKQAGSAFFDSAGKMKSMSDITALLSTALKGLSDEQRTNAVRTIFGMDAMRSALALASVGKDKFDELAKAIQSVSAQEMAEKRMRGLVGVVKLMKSALESLNIAIFDSGLADWLMTAFKGVTSFAAELSKTHPWVLKIVGALGLLAVTFGPIVLAMSVMAAGLASLITIIPAAAVIMTAPFWGVAVAIGAVIAAVSLLIAKWESVKSFFAGIPGSFSAGVPDLSGPGVAAANAKALSTVNTLNGEINVNAPPGMVKSTMLETSAPGDLGMNLAGTI